MGSFDPLRVNVDEEQHAVPLPRGEQAGSIIASGVRSERLSDDIFVISLDGEHDLYTAPKVHEELRSVIEAGGRTIVVDLSETTFLDSTMLNVLLRARHELREGDRLLLVINDPTVKRVFEIAGIDRFFDVCPSRRAAEDEVLASRDRRPISS